VDDFVFNLLTNAFCLEVDVLSFRISAKFLDLVVQALVVNEVLIRELDLEFFFVHHETLIQFSVVNEMVSSIHLNVPYFS
jgi:hypothetical protein